MEGDEIIKRGFVRPGILFGARAVSKAKDRQLTINRIWTGVILLIVTALLFVLLILKSMSVIRFSEAPLIYTYSIFLVTFQFTRVIAALLYKSHAGEEKKMTQADKDFFPTLSFIIPCKNEEAVIYENIEHCFTSDYPKDKIEVIVINDGSTDKTLHEIRRASRDFNNLKFINWRENQGKRRAMASAIKVAKGDIVIQLDSDSYIAPKDLKKLVLPFQNEKIAAVCAHATPSNKDKNILTKAQAGYYFMAFRILKAAESTFNIVLCCSGCCSAYRRSTILPLVDEFANENFLGVHVNFGDDRSLTNLILREGLRTVYVSNVEAYTIVPENLRTLLKQQIRWKKSWFINTTKASKFIWKKDSFVAFTYFYPLAIITLVTPLMAAYGLIFFPFIHHTTPVFFLLGSLLITALFGLIVKLISGNKYWMYLGVWALINTFMLTFILPYSLLTIRNGKWGTR